MIWNMTQPWMARELAVLEVNLVYEYVNRTFSTCRKSRNKSQIHDAAEENNSPHVQASNNTSNDEAVTP